MTKRTIFFLALAAAFAAAPAPAQEFSTSSGTHYLQPLTTINQEEQLQQAARSAERAIAALLADLAAMETARSAVNTELTGIEGQVKTEQEAIERARIAFEAADSRYRANLSAFQQRQTELEADVQRQRNEAAVLQALPSAQRDHSAVERLNQWAGELGTRRDALAVQREQLLQEHAAVEAERQKIAKQRADAEARLQAVRDSTVGRYGQAGSKLAQGYAHLRQAVDYAEQARALLQHKFRKEAAPSTVLERAKLKLVTVETRRALR